MEELPEEDVVGESKENIEVDNVEKMAEEEGVGEAQGGDEVEKGGQVLLHHS